MTLLLINGSPRGATGNSKLLLDAFAAGVRREDPNFAIAEVNLKSKTGLDDALRLAQSAADIVVAFPLYVDTMPAGVKELFEALPKQAEGEQPSRLGFVVQSGFPESSQSFPLERYLEKLCRRLGYGYLGTVIKGGGEVIRIPPRDAPLWAKIFCLVGAHTNLGRVGYLLNRPRLEKKFIVLGERYVRTGAFDPALVERLRSLRRLGPFGFLLYRIVGERCYWAPLLKRNGALPHRDARPFLPE